mgnify:CR=1 FL=1
MDILLGVFALGFFMTLMSGAYLLVEDSNKRFYARKKIQEENPNLSRIEIRRLAREQLRKEERNRNYVE